MIDDDRISTTRLYQRNSISGKQRYYLDTDNPDSLVHCQKKVQHLNDVINSVIGWRENDWPEGFDRRTAELIAEHVKELYGNPP